MNSENVRNVEVIWIHFGLTVQYTHTHTHTHIYI